MKTSLTEELILGILSEHSEHGYNIEKIIETKMRIEDLAKAIGKFNDKEQKLIHAIYFEGKTLKDIAKTHDTNLMRISRIRDKILRKLRKMLDR